MAAGRLHRPKAKSFWILGRRLLLRRNRKAAAGGDEEDRKEEKSGLLCSRSSLEQLLVTDAGGHGDSDVVCRAKKHGQAVAARLPGVARPEAVSVAAIGGRDGAGMHRRFVFGGFRRRLLMRRPWRPVLVAIPE